MLISCIPQQDEEEADHTAILFSTVPCLSQQCRASGKPPLLGKVASVTDTPAVSILHSTEKTEHPITTVTDQLRVKSKTVN